MGEVKKTPHNLPGVVDPEGGGGKSPGNIYLGERVVCVQKAMNIKDVWDVLNTPTICPVALIPRPFVANAPGASI
jgi:hypothetical protein